MMLNGTGDRIDGYDYPLTSDELVDRLGDTEIELPNGTETVGEVIERMGPETYQTAEDARFAVYGSVSAKAIGRRGYSDRDPYAIGENGPEPLSF